MNRVNLTLMSYYLFSRRSFVGEFGEEIQSQGLSLGTVRFFKNNQRQKESIEDQTQTNQSSHIDFGNKILQIVNSHFSNTSSILQAINNSNITEIASTVNSTGILSRANIIRASPAATLTKNEETTLNNGLEKIPMDTSFTIEELENLVNGNL